RVFIDEVKVLSCTLVKLGAARCIVTITDVSGQVAQEHRLERAEGDRQQAEARLAVAHEREQASREMDIQNGRFSAALSNMSQALCMFDSAGGLIVANSQVSELFSLDPASVSAGSTMEVILAHAVSGATLQQADVDALRLAVQELNAIGLPGSRSSELSDGRTLAVSYVPMKGDGWLLTLEDVTERKLAEAKIIHMAHHDALTGLSNRIMFHDRLGEAVARSLRGESSAVLYLDLDNFKTINDTLGHPVGDALLREVSQRLRKQVREIDTVARLGGDEFAIVQCGLEQPQDATTLARRLIEVLSEPYELDGHQVVIGASVGIALVPTDGQDPDQLLKNADMALYAVKAAGRGSYRFFKQEMDATMQARRTLEADLRKGLGDNQFELYYQPLMNIKTGSVIGFEALLRWNHPERGLVPPEEFIPLAEETGLIIPLGRWVLNQACADAATWPGNLKIAVNVSAVQFGCPTLIEDVSTALRASGLAPDRLEIEITETVMLDNSEAIFVILHNLRDLGLGIAMDDFGIGYSSLNYLRRFPFTKVKIDRSFIEGLGRVAECDAIVSAVTDLCETLGMATLAEGVETEEQLQQLRAGRCAEAQGYLFSRPRPASEVAALCLRLTQPELAATGD
ncbi:MAG: putative bifunctional diguanylate cyclase/phosphodiesterase, partial [Janthinobacterium lividum]